MISDFFVASPSEIERLDSEQDITAFPIVMAKSIDPIKLANLEEIILQTDADQILEETRYNVVKALDEDTFISAVRPTLVEVLPELTTQQQQHIAKQWAETDECHLDYLSEEDLFQVLQQLTSLTQQHLTKDKSVYLYLSV